MPIRPRGEGIARPIAKDLKTRGKELSMATYGRVLEVLRDYRNELEQRTQTEISTAFSGGPEAMAAFSSRGGMSAFATPLSNVHATGVGVRVRNDEIVPDEFVLKV